MPNVSVGSKKSKRHSSQSYSNNGLLAQSGLEHSPVTGKVTGSNPVGTAKHLPTTSMTWFDWLVSLAFIAIVVWSVDWIMKALI